MGNYERRVQASCIPCKDAGLCQLSQRRLVPDALMILVGGLWHSRWQQQRMGIRIHGQRHAWEFVLQVYQLVDLVQATTTCVPHSLVGSGCSTQIVDCGCWRKSHDSFEAGVWLRTDFAPCMFFGNRKLKVDLDESNWRDLSYHLWGDRGIQ